MDLRAMQFFLTLSEELHFGRAASRHFISSQAFGREIRALESKLGVELFTRTSRRVQLTPAGERSVQHVRSVLAAVEGLTAGAATRPQRQAASGPPRPGRREVPTRSALAAAAQRIFAEQGNTEASVQQITAAADVEPDSFYNDFSSKAELFHFAIVEMLDGFAADLDRHLFGMDDPAADYASSVRLTIRLARTDPVMARVIMNSPPSVAQSPEGLAGRALRCIRQAGETGRFRVDNDQVAWSWATGCAISSIRLCLLEPSAPVNETADLTAASLLRMHGLAEDEVQRLVALPLP